MKTSIPRRALWLSFLAVSLVSCDMPLKLDSIPLSYISAREGCTQKDTADTITKDDVHIYYCAVSFPKTYDWRKDSLYGAVDATIRLYRDSSLLKTLEAGPNHGISVYASDHIISGGNLYTLFRTLGKTHVKRNGQNLFFIDSDEVIKGFLVSEESVWTLGENRKGLFLRKDGATVFSRDGAHAYGELGELPQYPGGALYLDRGQICFAYSKGEVWHIVKDSEETLVSAGDMLDSAQGLRQCNGTIYMLGDLKEYPGPYMYVYGGTRYRMFYYTADEKADFRLFLSDGEVLFLGSIKSGTTGRWRTEMWNRTNQRLVVDGEPCYVYHYDVSGNNAYVAPSIDSSMVICTPSLGKIRIEGDYYWPGSRGAAWGWDITAVAINGRHPAFWVDGEKRELNVNGYISAVEIVRK